MTEIVQELMFNTQYIYLGSGAKSTENSQEISENFNLLWIILMKLLLAIL